MIAKIEQETSLFFYKLPRSSYDQAEMDDSSNNDTASEEEEENTDEEMEDDDKENDSSFMIINEPNNQEYVVDKIMDHGICAVDNKSMKFLIRWEGYCRKSEWTWEFEKDLYKVYEKIVEYRRRYKLGPTCLIPFGGADTSNASEFSINNWVTLTKVKETLLKHMQHERYHQTVLNLSILSKTLSEIALPSLDSCA